MATTNSRCICQSVWANMLEELGYLKEFLEDVITDQPTIHRSVLSALRDFQDEFKGQVDNLVAEIGQKCGRRHRANNCKKENGDYVDSDAGCDASDHHVLL